MKRYETYKETGTRWLDSVPSSWNVQKIGELFIQRNEKVSDKVFVPISVTKNGILPQLATAAKTDDGDNRKKVCIGDFVINSRSDRKGSCGVSELEGSVSLINTVLQLRKQLNKKMSIISCVVNHFRKNTIEMDVELLQTYGQPDIAK